MKRILISRTDNIGDVILTLPLAGILKEKFPASQIVFLGKGYTVPIIERCKAVDEVADWDVLKNDFEAFKELQIDVILHVFPNKQIAQWAARAKIQVRIGTSHRLFHWFYANRKVGFSRKKSALHESELNQKLLAPLGIHGIIPKEQLYPYVQWETNLQPKFNFGHGKKKLIFHTKSKGSAKDWPLSNYLELAKRFPASEFAIYITGTKAEGEQIRLECPQIFDLQHVFDVTGQFSLTEFCDFIAQCDGLLACSTGPLHIASTSGIFTLGLYPNKRPMHPGRWSPIGANAHFLEEKSENNQQTLNIGCDLVFNEIINGI